jgi:hypothetical protein
MVTLAPTAHATLVYVYIEEREGRNTLRFVKPHNTFCHALDTIGKLSMQKPCAPFHNGLNYSERVFEWVIAAAQVD